MTGVLGECRSGAVVTLALARPDRLNALDREFAAALCDALARLDSDPEERAIVLTMELRRAGGPQPSSRSEHRAAPASSAPSSAGGGVVPGRPGDGPL